MTDKNGKEILDNSYLKIKFRYGYGKGRVIRAIFKVWLDGFEGVTLNLVKSIYPKDLINWFFSWKYNQLSSRNHGKYNQLVICDTEGQGNIIKNTWKENHYSEDIEVCKKPRGVKGS